MCLFKYREKRYGKTALILFGILNIVLAAAAVFGGVFAVIKMAHWSRFIIVSVAGLVGLLLLILGMFCLMVSAGMIWKSKSVRDGNRMKGITGTRLCDKCGRVISKVAVVCEHCGTKLQTGHGLKSCPECKSKNSATAKFCEKCGFEFKD